MKKNKIMKKIHFTLLLAIWVTLLVYACKPENTYPSPLADVSVNEQTFKCDETSRTIEMRTRLVDVEAIAIDQKTGDIASWIKIEVNNTLLKFTLQENITIYDRQAKVTMKYVGTRTDLEGATETQFTVIQKKNKAFENLDVEDVQMRHLKGDTTIVTGLSLKNIKSVVTDLNGNKVNWCKVQISEYTNLLINVDENLNNSHRQALVHLTPSQQQSEVADSLIARKVFVVTQFKNPVLDSLKLGTITMGFEAGDTVLKTRRQLKGIQSVALNADNGQRWSWGTVKSIAGDSIILHVNKLTSKNDRSAKITLYLPNNGTTIDSTTIAYTFSLTQKHNNVLEGRSIPAQKMTFDQAADTIRVAYSLNGFKAALVDSLTDKEPTWLQAVVKEHEIILRATSKNLVKSDRKATVTIYQPNGSNVIDTATVSMSFKVTQLHNDVFEGRSIPAQTMTFDQETDTIKVEYSLKDFRAVLTDSVTGTVSDWMNATVSEHAIILKAISKNVVNSDRRATVTIFQPHNGNVIDENTICTSFKVTQLHNNVLEGRTIPARQMNYNQKADTIKLDYSLKGFKAAMVDNRSGIKPEWLVVAVDDRNIILRATKDNMARSNRQATVTIYQPNNGTTIDEKTISTSFKVTHLHNSATDKLTIANREIEADQNKDSIAIGCSLKGFTSRTIDRATSVTANWLRADVKENMIYLYSSTNNSNDERSALVTIYQPNNDAVYKDTIQHTFLVKQKAKKRLEPSRTSLVAKYNSHTIKDTITSNVKYTVHESYDWILGHELNPINDLQEELVFQLAENTGTSDRKATITLSSGNMNAKITLTQKTNPEIEFEDIKTDNLLFNKYQSKFTLKIATLTPGYTIQTSNKSSWIQIGNKTNTASPYQHDIYIRELTGDTIDRKDTIIVKNFEVEKRLAIRQINHLALDKTEAELEVGEQMELECMNKTKKQLTWSSTNEHVATVDQNGMVTAKEPGNAKIVASVGAYESFQNYKEECNLTVYNAASKQEVELDKTKGSFLKEGDYYTTDCPIIVKNTLNRAVTIDNVTILNNDSTYYSRSDDQGVTLNLGEQHSYTFKKMEKVLSPYIIINLTSKGEKYQKKVYFNRL